MARTIDTEVAKIRNAVYGADVREAIASALEKLYDACVTSKSTATAATAAEIAAVTGASNLSK